MLEFRQAQVKLTAARTWCWKKYAVLYSIPLKYTLRSQKNSTDYLYRWRGRNYLPTAGQIGMDTVNGMFDSCIKLHRLSARIPCLNLRNQVPRSSYMVPVIIYLLGKGDTFTQPKILGRRAESLLLQCWSVPLIPSSVWAWGFWTAQKPKSYIFKSDTWLSGSYILVA